MQVIIRDPPCFITLPVLRLLYVSGVYRTKSIIVEHFVKMLLIRLLHCLINQRQHFIILAVEKILTWHFGGIMKSVYYPLIVL